MIEKQLRLDEIKIPKSRIRTSVEKSVDMERLVDSIKKLGLFHPILVDEDYNLIAGFRRLTAYRQLKLGDPIRFGRIAVRIMPRATRIRALEAEIHENWARKQLRGYELDTALAEYKELYQMDHPETKRGASMRQAEKGIPTKTTEDRKNIVIGETAVTILKTKPRIPRFAESMSKTLGIEESTVEKRTRVGEAIIEGKFDEETVEEYKQGLKGHTEMLKIFQEQKKAKKKELEKKEDHFKEINGKIVEFGYGLKKDEKPPEPKIKPDAPDVVWDAESYEVIVSWNFGAYDRRQNCTIEQVREIFRQYAENDEFWFEIEEPGELTFGVVSYTEKDKILGLK